MRIVVLGIVGRTPLAGVAWQALHYLEGFRRLGHEVHYVEDTRAWPYDPVQAAPTPRCDDTVAYLARVMQRFGFGERWAYRGPAPRDELFGLSHGALRRVFRDADVVVDVTGSTPLRDEHRTVPARILVDTDPGLDQIRVAQGHAETIARLEAYTHHFTFGANVGAPDCPLPAGGFAYRPTRQPVVLDWWATAPARAAAGPRRFTTVSTWRHTAKDVVWNGVRYRWSKHGQFATVMTLPGRTAQRMELALACDDAGVLARLRSHGWHVVDAIALSCDPSPYRGYIHGSDAEFSVARDQYVSLRTGWFSDRSACYLAAGRPVVVQDTAFQKAMPAGVGILAFGTPDDAVAALDEVARNYATHAGAAREIAAEYFCAERVLARLLDEAV